MGRKNHKSKNRHQLENKKNKLCKEKNKKSLNYKELFGLIGTVIGLIGTVIGIVLSKKSLDSGDFNMAIENYQKGIIYLEDDDFEQAQQCFEKVYEIDNNLLDIKFYYTYTEYKLENYDKSYQILKENRNRLSENELAFYAMYEFSRGDYEKSKEYLNKIRQPENLQILSFSHYIIISTELSFCNNYFEGISTFYSNMILLEAKINEAQQLPESIRRFYIKTENTEDNLLNTADEVAKRIKKNAENEVLLLNTCKLVACSQFIAHSIQQDEYDYPVFILEDAAKSVDFDSTDCSAVRNFLEILFLYAVYAEFEPKQPEDIKEACKIVIEHYKKIELLENQTGEKIIEQRDRKNLKELENVLNYLDNNSLDQYTDNFYFYFLEGTYENYSTKEKVKLWADTFLNKIYINNLIK